MRLDEASVLPPSQETRPNWPAAFVLLVVTTGVGHADDRAAPGPAKLSPSEVVRGQMEGLSAWRGDAQAAGRVFELASPANRAVTGPLENFRQLVEKPPYDALLDNQGWRIGRAVEKNGLAVVLVTLIDKRGEPQAFRFYLSQQAEIEDRWRTDAVLGIPLQRPAAPPADERI